jgi:hypothetical protein
LPYKGKFYYIKAVLFKNWFLVKFEVAIAEATEELLKEGGVRVVQHLQAQAPEHQLEGPPVRDGGVLYHHLKIILLSYFSAHLRCFFSFVINCQKKQ